MKGDVAATFPSVMNTLRSLLSLLWEVAPPLHPDAEKVESHLRCTMSQEGIVALCLRGSMQSLSYNMAGAKRKGQLLFLSLYTILGQHFLSSKYERA